MKVFILLSTFLLVARSNAGKYLQNNLLNRKLTVFRKYLTFENLCLNPDHLAILGGFFGMTFGAMFEGNSSGQLYWAVGLAS
jgi:hypothetical protein